MKLIQTTTIAFLLIASTAVFGQTGKQKPTKEQQAELRLKAKQEANQSRTSKVSMDENDGYAGKKQSILKRLKVSEIPASFPKYTKETTKEDYKLMVRKWFKANKSLVKPEYQEKLK